jgi:hypothetical protein
MSVLEGKTPMIQMASAQKPLPEFTNNNSDDKKYKDSDNCNGYKPIRSHPIIFKVSITHHLQRGETKCEYYLRAIPLKVLILRSVYPSLSKSVSLV